MLYSQTLVTKQTSEMKTFISSLELKLTCPCKSKKRKFLRLGRNSLFTYVLQFPLADNYWTDSYPPTRSAVSEGQALPCSCSAEICRFPKNHDAPMLACSSWELEGNHTHNITLSQWVRISFQVHQSHREEINWKQCTGGDVVSQLPEYSSVIFRTCCAESSLSDILVPFVPKYQ